MPNPQNEKRLKNRFLVWLGGAIGPGILRFLYNTNQWETKGEHHYKEAINSGKSVIVASWH